MDISADEAVTVAVEDAAEGEICAAWHDEESGCGLPRFREEGGLGDGGDGIVGVQQGAEGSECVGERYLGGAGTFFSGQGWSGRGRRTEERLPE